MSRHKPIYRNLFLYNYDTIFSTTTNFNEIKYSLEKIIRFILMYFVYFQFLIKQNYSLYCITIDV